MRLVLGLIGLTVALVLCSSAQAGPFGYISNSGSNTVSVINTATDTVVATVPVGSQPFGVAVNATATIAYVANRGSNNVSVVDLPTHSVVATIPVGATPIALGQFIGPSATGGIADNYQGLWWATGGTEAFWGINFAHSDDKVFATWYTYDTTGKAWWLSMLATRTTPTGNTYSGKINVDIGPPFNDFVSSATPIELGDGTLTFTDVNNGTFHYDLSTGSGGSPLPVSQTKAIARYDLGTGAQPTCAYDPTANLALATNYQDLWWVANAVENGWGINFAHQGNNVFLTWYTYDLSGAPLWLSALTERQGTSDVYMGPLLRTSGPRYDAYEASDVVQPIPTVGTATLTFATGNSATFNYTTNGNGGLPSGVNQTKSIVRYPLATGGTACQ